MLLLNMVCLTVALAWAESGSRSRWRLRCCTYRCTTWVQRLFLKNKRIHHTWGTSERRGNLFLSNLPPWIAHLKGFWPPAHRIREQRRLSASLSDPWFRMGDRTPRSEHHWFRRRPPILSWRKTQNRLSFLRMALWGEVGYFQDEITKPTD
jgi:hypothetical protein